ncbi:MAG: Uncharacterised protein [Flavobacterium sp. SCGC AAA160-P02]|nr:MAG: Uncharacterised protein [Flavobacterium sp. SCGC AAA160-P02]
MNKIKDVTLLVFAIIGFYTVISSFTTKPQENGVGFMGTGEQGLVEGKLRNINYSKEYDWLYFETYSGQAVTVSLKNQ